MVVQMLVDYDDGRPIVPSLAQSWEMSADGRRFDFRLRTDVQFSTGRPMTAADVKYSLERLMRPSMHSPGAEFFRQVEGAADYAAGKATEVSGIATPAPDRVTFALEAVDPLFLHKLAMPFAHSQW